MSTIKEMLENDIENLKNMRLSGMQVKEIASVYGVHPSCVSDVLIRHRILWRRDITESDIPDIVSAYCNGEAVDKIATRYHVTSSKVSDILKSEGIRVCKRNKYSLNENYFDIIDAPEKAYILGLLLADGNKSKQNSIRLQLQDRDRDVLEKITDLIGSNRPLTFIDLHSKNVNHRDAYLLEFSSKHICETLAKYGIVPQKDFKVVFPTQIHPSLYRHVIRGLFDGDGTIYPKEGRTGLTGNGPLIDFVAQYFETVLGVHCSVRPEHNSPHTKVLRVSGRIQASKVLDYLYDGATIYINRKYDCYKQLCARGRLSAA